MRGYGGGIHHFGGGGGCRPHPIWLHLTMEYNKKYECYRKGIGSKGNGKRSNSKSSKGKHKKKGSSKE